MATLCERPYGNFNFLADVGTGNSDVPEAGFDEALLPETWLDVIEYRNGNEKENGVRKSPAASIKGIWSCAVAPSGR